MDSAEGWWIYERTVVGGRGALAWLVSIIVKQKKSVIDENYLVLCVVLNEKGL